ncbi:MAG TPA: MarR family transcriptional regulator [Stackebrandtia sp.]|uniref:MarR family winged helix-turn-helix transcriptional regulator n=1 Tax=Stackebrandtia sp. TaxID=2023065 RepID=UPI002D25EFE9|nr:MarR family transcriptional regulator [Stackebrandtia sp.]HZE40653.1 MarR family transcriptional regulator [Stackebrandtia sp.]
MVERDQVDDIVAAWRTELPEAAGPQLGLGKRVHKLADLFNQALDPLLSEHGVTKVEYAVLATLRAAGAPYRLKPGALSKYLVITTGGISNVLIRLADNGLVTREPDPADRRSSWVQLTPRGVSLSETLAKGAAEAQGALIEPLSPAATQKLTDLLREALIILERR